MSHIRLSALRPQPNFSREDPGVFHLRGVRCSGTARRHDVRRPELLSGAPLAILTFWGAARIPAEIISHRFRNFRFR